MGIPAFEGPISELAWYSSSIKEDIGMFSGGCLAVLNEYFRRFK